jgi:Animal haem peroxidase
MHGFNYREPQIPRGRFNDPGRFGRMFPWLRSLKSFDPGPDKLGEPEKADGTPGPMNGGSGFDPTQDNPRIKAGYTFLGQFVDHDLTLDTTSILERQVDVNGTTNFRTPAFELDSVYGLGPAVQPYLYVDGKAGKLLISQDGTDLQRNWQGRAIIGDPRNDENSLITQLHLLFIKFHNKVWEAEVAHIKDEKARFEEAQRLVRWHYQWLVMNEFLPRLVGTNLTQATMAAPPFEFTTDHAFMPVEFSVAAYRFGHSQVRPGYALRPGPVAGGPPAVAILFPGIPDAPENDGDLRGFQPLSPALHVDWAFFFGPTAQASKFIDTRISGPLLKLPTNIVPKDDPIRHRSLASRNLQRGIDMYLPSGQTLACHLGMTPLSDDQIWTNTAGPALGKVGSGPAPLWYYCLREGEVLAGGHRLAGVGAAIVARTFVALMLKDKASYLVQDPGFVPTLGTGNRFTMTDMVNYTLGSNIPSEDLSALPGNDGPGV